MAPQIPGLGWKGSLMWPCIEIWGCMSFYPHKNRQKNRITSTINDVCQGGDLKKKSAFVQGNQLLTAKTMLPES